MNSTVTFLTLLLGLGKTLQEVHDLFRVLLFGRSDPTPVWHEVLKLHILRSRSRSYSCGDERGSELHAIVQEERTLNTLESLPLLQLSRRHRRNDPPNLFLPRPGEPVRPLDPRDTMEDRVNGYAQGQRYPEEVSSSWAPSKTSSSSSSRSWFIPDKRLATSHSRFITSADFSPSSFAWGSRNIR